MASVKDVQYNATRPTSVVIMLLIFQGFKLVFPKAMSNPWEEWTLNAITVVGGTGIIEKAWNIWGDNIKDLFLKLFKKK